MAQGSPSRRQDQFVLRLPDGMRERLKEAAETNHRSMNAEIVARLQDSLDICTPEDDRKSEPHIDLSSSNTLYVVLDTNGMPTSWHEAITHLNYITSKADIPFSSQSAYILTPEVISSNARLNEDYRLIQEYKKLLKSKPSAKKRV